MKRFIICLLFLQLILESSYGQIKSSLSGVIKDEQSSPIANATVHLLNTNSQTISDEHGNFRLNNLFPGTYQIEVTAIGYATINKTLSIEKGGNNIQFSLRQTSKQLNEVVVTAQKEEADLQKIPASITSISGKEVEAFRIQNTKEITAIVPDLYSADPGDKRNVTSIRGITTTSYNPAIATYVDGVNQFNLDTYISTLFDVERIEILRGPQGTLYGRNAMGGVINIITKKPENRTDGFASVDIGNYGFQQYSAGVRTPLIKDKLFIGIAFQYQHLNGYYTNEFNNTDYDRQHSLLGNYYIKYLPSNRWAVTFNVKHNANRNKGAFPLVPDIKEAFDHPFALSQNAITTLMDNIFNASLSLNFTGRAFNFSSQTAYQSNYRYYSKPIDADFSPLDGITIINNYGKDWNNVKVFTQEFKFSSPAATTSLWKWTAGSYLFHNDNPVKQATRFGNDAEMLGMQDKNFSLINTTKAKSGGTAFYGQATYAITSQLSITAGARYDYEHQQQNIKGEYQHDPNPQPMFDYRSDTSASINFSAFSPSVSAAIHFSDNNLFYATYNKGYRVGGLTPLSSDPSQPALYPFKPEYSNNIEIGIKNCFANNKFIWNVAAFYSTVTDAQVPTLVLPDAVTITKNTGRLTSKGIETEFMSKPFKGLEINYTFGYTDAKYQSLKIAQNGVAADFKGKRQVFTPNVTSYLTGQYVINVDKKRDRNLFFTGEWKYLGTQYFDLANTITQLPYHLLNVNFGFTSKKISIMLWAKNLTDTKYISYAYDFGAVHLGTPKTYGVSFKSRF
ncbi:MAG TPA: TonB-dependent receptor [Hanamia sp.]|nr:TonB-dependent receptor [Hanamia sp.]